MAMCLCRRPDFICIAAEQRPRWGVESGLRTGENIVIGKTYLVRQAETLLRFAKSTNDPQTAAALLEKAAELKEQSSARPDQSLAAPDVQPAAS